MAWAPNIILLSRCAAPLSKECEFKQFQTHRIFRKIKTNINSTF
jgi:hypothetical protein